jgi:transcription initiation factor TFIID TATA-box-binding protein
MESTIKIENVVASTKLAEEFDLHKIEVELDGAEYNKKKFPCLVYRVKSPKAAFLIFTSGKIVCTGSKNVKDVRTVITNLAKMLKSIGFEKINLEPEIHVQNIVSSADLKTRLNLNAVALGLGLENIEYEPEQFPGLVYRIKQPTIVVLIFGSGKLVITGGKSPEECEEGARIVRMQLENMGLL